MIYIMTSFSLLNNIIPKLSVSVTALADPDLWTTAFQNSLGQYNNLEMEDEGDETDVQINQIENGT